MTKSNAHCTCVCVSVRESGVACGRVCVCAAFCNIAYCATHLNSIKLQRQLHKTRAAKQAPHAYNNVKQDDDDDTKDADSDSSDADCDDEVARL